MVTDHVTEDTAVVSWHPVQAVIDKYVVRYTSADGEAKDTAVPGEQRSTVLTGLKPGEAYKVHVWAERGNQESEKADTEALTGNGRTEHKQLSIWEKVYFELRLKPTWHQLFLFTEVWEGIAKAISKFIIMRFFLYSLQ